MAANRLKNDELQLEMDIERIAREELLQETKKAKTRTETMGATGWQACPLPRTNKRFLRNMILGTISKSKKQDSLDGDCPLKQRKRQIDERNLPAAKIYKKQTDMDVHDVFERHENYSMSKKKREKKSSDRTSNTSFYVEHNIVCSKSNSYNNHDNHYQPLKKRKTLK